MQQDDMALVREFVATQSEAAFGTLVQRHIGLIYSAGFRQTNDTHLAEEITQAVFIILARKAATLGRDTILPAWLYRTALYAAADALKQQRRRQAREQEAYMQSNLEGGGDAASPAAAETLAAWQQLAPVLDDAMADLGDRDRAAVVLRYFENRPWAEVAAQLQMTEDAAQKRVTRALEKLRKLFAKRDVALTGALIVSAVAGNSVQAAPVALVKTISAVAMTKGAAASTSTLTLVKGALQIMAWTKMQTAIVIGLGMLLSAGITTEIAVKKFREHREDAWQLGNVNSKYLIAPPYRTLVLPTKSALRTSKDGSGGFVCMADGRIYGINILVIDMVRMAHSSGQKIIASARTVVAITHITTNRFDFFSNLPTGARESLSKLLEAEFKLSASPQLVETNVLALKVKGHGTDRLQISKSDKNMASTGGGSIVMTRGSMDDLASALEADLGIPMVNQTGLNGDFDFKLKWKQSYEKSRNLEELQKALADQLGLELIPTIAPIEMLIIQQVK